jgi:hypothetical protein
MESSSDRTVKSIALLDNAYLKRGLHVNLEKTPEQEIWSICLVIQEKFITISLER